MTMTTKSKLYVLALAAATFTTTLTVAEARVVPGHPPLTRQSVHFGHAVNVTRHPIQSLHFVNLARHSIAGLPVAHQPAGSGKGGVKPDFDIGGAINGAVNTVLNAVNEGLELLNNDPGPTCGWLVCSDGSK
jgi:hypothetical protein